MDKRLYRIGHTGFEICMEEDIPSPKNLELFRVETSDKDSTHNSIVYYMKFTDDIAALEAELRKEQDGTCREVKRDNLSVFQSGRGECRVINFKGAEKPYAITCQEEEHTVRVWYDREVAPMLLYDTVFLAALCMEKFLIKDEAMILHSAYMWRDDKAILFSAPSGTGKSTQADLWEKYRGTRTVNGDRSLLIRENDGWYAYGFPICGSSEICHNEAYPVRAIVMLKQAKENQVYKLSGVQAVRELMGQITVNAWDVDFQMKVIDKLEQLIAEVPVYRQECDISEEAVECLEDALGR